MKKFTLIFSLIIGMITFSAQARDFIRYERVDITRTSNNCDIPKYKSFDSNDYYSSFGEWDIILGNEVRYGVYQVLNSYERPMGALINLNESGLTGYAGTLVYEVGRVEKPNVPAYQNYPRYYYSPYYVFYLNPYSN